MYFADKPIPANESDANASALCSSVEGAKKYCPNRWKAMQNWFAEARKVSNEIFKYMLKLDSPSSPFFLFLCLHFSIFYHILDLLMLPQGSYSHIKKAGCFGNFERNP